MTAVFIILAVFSVPLAAIVSSAWLKAKRIEAESASPKLLAELSELRQRVQVLEDIATGGGELRALPPRHEPTVDEVHELELTARR